MYVLVPDRPPIIRIFDQNTGDTSFGVMALEIGIVRKKGVFGQALTT